jgi:hypothetical protein
MGRIAAMPVKERRMKRYRFQIAAASSANHPSATRP